MMKIHRQAEAHRGLKRTMGDPNRPDIRDTTVGVEVRTPQGLESDIKFLSCKLKYMNGSLTFGCFMYFEHLIRRCLD